MTNKEIVEENGYEDVILFDNPSYEGALIGITDNNEAVYDFDLMCEYLVENEDMDYEEAADFICFNDSYRQKGQPIIINSFKITE